MQVIIRNYSKPMTEIIPPSVLSVDLLQVFAHAVEKYSGN